MIIGGAGFVILTSAMLFRHQIKLTNSLIHSFLENYIQVFSLA